MSATEEKTLVIDLIEMGQLDTQLEEIKRAIDVRMKADSYWMGMRSRQAKRNRKVWLAGQRVQIRDCRPKYLCGCTGTVREDDGGGRVIVDLDEAPRPGKTRLGWRMTRGTLEAI